MILELMGSYFGKEIITESGKSLYNNIVNILSYHIPEVQEILKSIDINNDIKIIRSLISEVEDKHFNSTTFNTSLNSVNEMLENINIEIKAIEKEIIDHKQKYFYNWRTPNYEDNLKNLKKMKIILNERLDYFVKITQVLDNLNINNASSNVYNDVTNICYTSEVLLDKDDKDDKDNIINNELENDDEVIEIKRNNSYNKFRSMINDESIKNIDTQDTRPKSN